MTILENKSYAGSEETKAKYLGYLQGTKEWSSDYYTDPDMTHEKGAESEFYSSLVEYLNAMENSMKKDDKNWRKYKYTAVPKVEGNAPPSGIEVRVSDNPEKEPIMYLRSDQFGFSAPKGKNRAGGAWNIKKYPYARYIESAQNNETANYCELVADVIWDTRRLGGSFIWPIIKNKSWQSIYNTSRGVKSYIEDRVDITLWEIKKFYEKWNKFTPKDSNNKLEEFICKINKEKKNKETQLILLSGIDRKEIAKWLVHFESFDNYVKFFSFESFLNNKTNNETPNIRNIITGEDLSCDVCKIKKGKQIASLDNKNELEDMLKRLQKQTNCRTNIMIQKVSGQEFENMV